MDENEAYIMFTDAVHGMARRHGRQVVAWQVGREVVEAVRLGRGSESES